MARSDAGDAGDERLEDGMSGHLVTATTVFAMTLGIPAAQLESATGLSMAELTDPDARLPNVTVAKIWPLMLAAQPERSLPLAMATAAPRDYMGPLAYGMQYVDSLREAIACMNTYRKVLSSELEFGEELRPGQTVCWFTHPNDALDEGASGLVGLALGFRFVTDLLAMPDAVAGVELYGRPLGPAADYEAFFGVPVRFETGRLAMVFRSDRMDARPPSCNPEIYAYIQKRLDLARERLRVADGLGGVREAMARLATRSEYGAEALAKELGMSLRALQRHVAAEGTTLRGLIDEMREANARELLTDRRLSVEEVAFLLGYSDERAFRRAFKRTSGSTPAQYRRSLRPRI
ncbi:putative transcriptional regulator, AraC family protein [Plesiocystis pacifica SIR-1]|uniref:Putative transcriptional regulator, AraC family protein n=1 Tax=Plesiocystis pacifica SIR-1 TaxID=391625 RepID=A6G583_9BACT|nr:AraC family transcriptional regulator [Plesiocystis pacifica]EDM78995.1 putative transcriptional regulator, AraC family protein [Plesiocystis pacifica SIR-1]